MPFKTLPSTPEITLHYEIHGDDAAPPLLLLMGMGAPLGFWPAGFVSQLAADYRVIVYDHRDIGRSTRLRDAKLPSVGSLLWHTLRRTRPPVPYTLDDLADDAAQLLEALQVPQAALVGLSMGGMVALRLAARQPARVSSLALLMSGGVDLRQRRYWPQARLLLHFCEAPAQGEVERTARLARWFDRIAGAPGRYDQVAWRQQLQANYRDWAYGPGVRRQWAATVASPPLDLATISQPTCLIHGDADPLVPFIVAQDTAAQLPHSELHVLPSIGHELTPAMTDHWLSVLRPFWAKHPPTVAP